MKSVHKMKAIKINGKDFIIQAWPVSEYSSLYAGKQLHRVVVIHVGLDVRVYDGKIAALGEEEARKGVQTIIEEEMRIGTRDKEGFRIRYA